MKTITAHYRLVVGAIFAIVAGTAFILFQARARGQSVAPAAGPQQTNVTVLDNSRVAVRRDTFPVGMHQAMHGAGTAGDNRYVLMIQLTPGRLEAVVDGKKTVSDKPGTVWELPGAPSQHAFANLSQQPIDVMVIQLK